jgi:hypothetical protein
MPSSFVRMAMGATLALAAVAALSGPARAHITLESPPDWLTGGGLLAPAQKREPCGDPQQAAPSGQITTFHPGDLIPVKWTEVIPHTGWFRLALTPDRALLKEPVATVDPATGNAKDATITRPEQTMVNVDGVYVMDGLYHHDAGDAGKQYTWMFPVPDIRCARCTLQLIQFMVDHGSNTGGNDGFFYHHCADIAITGGDAGAPPAADAGAPAPADAAASTPPASESSGCTVAGSPTTGAVPAILGVLALLVRRGRRRRA